VWLACPATHILLAVNIGIWLAMVSTKVSPISPTVNQLVFWGADRAGNVLIEGEWWRIVTAMFVHVGIIHLATNMWCLWNLGLLAEPLMGSWGVLAVYILTGAAGNLLSTFSNWWSFESDWMKYHDLGVFPAGAGASGAVFGIAGALIILLKSNRLPVPPIELKKLRRSVIYFAAINLFIGISISYGTHHFGKGILIDNYAHMGGCACGLLFAAPMVPRLGSPRPSFNLRLRIAMGMVVGLLVLFSFFLVQLSSQN
jgi:rhomboid protease GluP